MWCPENTNCWCWCWGSSPTPTCTPISTILNWWWLDIDTTTNSEWCQVVTITNPTEVISSDSSVNIVRWYYDGGWVFVEDEDGMVFDLKKPCCEDRLVATSSGDNQPWHLMSKLHSCNDILTITEETIAWVKKAQFCIDQSKIIWVDEKARYDAWCTPWYIKPMLKQWFGISLQDSSCWKTFSVNRSLFIKPILKRYLSSTLVTTYGHWQQAALPNNWWFPIYTDQYIDSWWFFIYTEEYTIPSDPKPWSTSDWWWTSWWFIIPKKWFYRVRMNTNIWVNRWVEACRVSLAWLLWWDYKILLNIWFANSNNYSLAEFESTNTWDSSERRIWNWCATSDILLFDEWDIIYWLFWRMNNQTSWWPWNATTDAWIMWVFTWPFWFNPFWTWNQAPSNPEYAWTYWWIEWISDQIWDSIY